MENETAQTGLVEIPGITAAITEIEARNSIEHAERRLADKMKPARLHPPNAGDLENVSRNTFLPRPNESKGAFSGNSEKSIW